MSHRLRVAVVGVGRWGYNLAKTLATLDGCEVVALCDSNLRQAQQVAEELSVSITTEHIENVLEGDSEAVVIATPPETHARLATLSLQAGKHVFVEKPLATSLAEGLELERAATASGKLVMAGHLLRFHGGVACLRRLVGSGELGGIDFSLSRRLGWRAADRCGPWWSLAPHDLSVLRGCLGVEPERIAAAAALEPPVSWNPVRALFSSGVVGQRPAIRSPIRVVAGCEFADGVRSIIDVGLLDQSKMRRVVLVGRRNMARFDDGDGGGVWIKATPRTVSWPKVPSTDHAFSLDEAERVVDMVEDLSNRGESWTLVESDWPRPLGLEMRQFVASCENPKLARIEMEDALSILRVLDAGARSMRDDSRCVRVLPKTRAIDNNLDAPSSAPDW